MRLLEAEQRIEFKILSRDRTSQARTGLITTKHGTVRTPAFMPVGTAAAVKTLHPDELRASGVELVLGNTYHILHNPGTETIERLGGLSRFMGWGGPTLTDSGGFQVFSLSATRKLTEEGVVFQSVYDGRTVELTPEEACRIQWSIGADIFYALDECPPYPASEDVVSSAVGITIRWAKRFQRTYNQLADREDNRDKVPFLVVQGGLYDRLRKTCSEEIAALDPPGFGIGGVSVGEPPEEMLHAAQVCCGILPDAKPRHLLGVGTPQDIIEAIGLGVDLFDCVLPTRNGRNGQAFTSTGVINLRLKKWKDINRPLDENCHCSACRQFSVGYLHHLMNTGEILGLRLLSLHNIAYYQSLVSLGRQAIDDQRYDIWKRSVELGWKTGS